MDLFESVNKLLQDKHTLTEAKTVLRVTFDNGMKKDIEFKGSFEAGKKAYLGKNVKAMSKDKTPVMLKAVKVEPINESKENKEFGISDLALKELQRFGSDLWVDMFSGPEGKQFRKDVQNAMNELVSKKYVDRKETGSDTHEKKYIYKITKKGIKFLKDNEKNLPKRLPNLRESKNVEFINEAEKLVSKKDNFEIYFDANTQTYNVYKDGKFFIGNKYKYSDVKSYVNESKDLEAMKTFKVTFHDGSSYKTSARAKSAEDFKKYLTQDGPWIVTDEDEETGKETKKKIVKVEMLDEGDKSNELKDGDLVFYNDGREWLKGKLISDEQISATGNKFWYVDSFANRRTRNDIKTPEEMREFRNKKLTGVKQI